MLAGVDAHLEGLSSSSYFALVMATGIVSVGAHVLSVAVVDIVLFAINIAAYLTLRLPDAPFLDSVRPFLEGLTIFYWANRNVVDSDDRHSRGYGATASAGCR